MKDNFKFILGERVLEATKDEGDRVFIYTANKESDGLYRVTWTNDDDLEDFEAFYTIEEVKISLADKDWIIVENDA